jgi:hypothetical protein
MAWHVSFLTNNKIQARMPDLEKTFRTILGRMMNKTVTTEAYQRLMLQSFKNMAFPSTI